MTIKKARDILGDNAKKRSDEEIQAILNTLTTIASIATDTVLKMKPEQRKRVEKKLKNDEK